MRGLLLLAAALAGAVSLPEVARAPSATREIPAYWRTRAERSEYLQTPDYEETMRYCRQLEAGSTWIRVTSFGVSGQGRDLPLVIVSKDRAFTPEAARATGKPILLVQNGIHAGEIEGKDASLALMRDLAVLRDRADLLDHAILLVVPILSVDAHQRSGPYNRINQNGPEQMGWRFTPIGLNLNRDYLKAETPELRGLLGNVFARWRPHLLVDTHTTDGADYRHDLTYDVSRGPNCPAPVERWTREAFEGRVVPRLAAMGHLPAPYLTFRDGNHPESGIQLGAQAPRFSTGYAPLQCRPGVLVETHMLKPYRTRVLATYDVLLALLEEVNTHPTALTGAVAEAESLVVARGREADPARREVALSAGLSDVSVPFAFKGLVTRWEVSEITGAPVPHYTDAPWDTLIPLYRDLEPAVVVREPRGYLVPQEWTACRERLDIHGVRYRRLARAWSDSVEVQRVTSWSGASRPYEGHWPISVRDVSLERRVRSFRPGDLWVPLDQPAALVAVHLFEALAPDAMLYWNAFDTVLSPKEYAEDYVMEPLARRMMQDDPALARAFADRVASDTSFARDPGARVDFFFRRSKWADPEANLLPVARALRPPPESVFGAK